MFRVLLLIAFGGALAFVMEVFEFLVLMKTSSLTLSIIGISKVHTAINLSDLLTSHNMDILGNCDNLIRHLASAHGRRFTANQLSRNIRLSCRNIRPCHQVGKKKVTFALIINF